MSEAGRGDLRTIANGLFPAGFDAAALMPEGRDEVRDAVDVILRLDSERCARLTLALEQLDNAANEYDRLRTALADAEREIERQKTELSFAGNLAKGNIARAERAEADLAAARKVIEQLVDVIAGARSGYISGTQPDCEWDQFKNDALKEAALQGHRRTGGA